MSKKKNQRNQQLAGNLIEPSIFLCQLPLAWSVGVSPTRYPYQATLACFAAFFHIYAYHDFLFFHTLLLFIFCNFAAVDFHFSFVQFFHPIPFHHFIFFFNYNSFFIVFIAKSRKKVQSGFMYICMYVYLYLCNRILKRKYP